MDTRPLPILLTTLLLTAALSLPALPVWAAALGRREVLPNGMVLVVAERRAVPIVTVSMLIQAGSIFDPPEKPGVANLVAQLLTQGTKTRTAPQISEAIEFIGGALSVDAGHELTSISLSVLSKDLDLGLDLMADVLRNPTFNPEDVRRKIQEVVAGIKHDQEDPGTVSSQAFLALLYGASPFGRPVEGTEASVPTITRDDLMRFHAAYFHPDKTILAVVGDVSEADLRQRLSARLGAWQSGGPAVVPPPSPAPVGQAGGEDGAA